MKKLLQIIVFIIAISTQAKSQTTLYADSVIAFSSEYSTPYWGAKQMIGAPDTYPACGDIVTAWTNPSGNTRDWIVLHYTAAINVDTVKIYETNFEGAIDTVYLRNSVTQQWNVIYTAAPIYLNSCKVLTIGMAQTSYSVDALRFSLESGLAGYNEYDAASITQNPAPASTHELNNSNRFSIYPNPCTNNFMVKLQNQNAHNDLAIYSILGNKVFEKNDIKQSEMFSPNLSKGIYFVEITNELNKKSINKLIIE